MGLDMYASRKFYVKQWDHQAPDERYSVHVLLGGKPVNKPEPERISFVEEEVMYWRKANHVHQWFVEHVQNGIDNCGEYGVSLDKLVDLKNVCDQVMNASKLVDGMVYDGTVWDKEHPNGIRREIPGKVIEDSTVAKKLLPTTEGFFFGSCDYDEHYLADVVATRDWCKRMIEDEECGVRGDIYYSSSW